ncbi:hypothetical protein CEXT_353871 [Caerostris extrusa]|uniref:Uncharacterized protein n=1 Tax=Caerostris extrusa TaxID=172846 RepID=A0AAV4X383_CAEEX|nr:hypothetical protein CEXT_353871 [Caerostris extrusa]
MVNKPMAYHAHYASRELKQSSQTANSPFATKDLKTLKQSSIEAFAEWSTSQCHGHAHYASQELKQSSQTANSPFAAKATRNSYSNIVSTIPTDAGRRKVIMKRWRFRFGTRQEAFVEN